MPKVNALFLFNVEYQNGYKGKDPQTLCPANPGGGPVTCATGSVGPPADDDKELVGVEGRTEFKHVGLSLKLTWDFEKDVFGADLPVLLVRNSDKQFNAGLRAGWQSDTHDLSIGVFVGKAFSMSP